MDYQLHQLSNGIRLIHLPVSNLVAHLGVMVNTGSRDEQPAEHGFAHLIEHMLFKGTKRRKAFHILSRLEDVGGEINAYTTKEETCVYASFMKEDYRRCLDLLSDILFHSAYPEREIVRETEVIIDEINSYLDSPGEQIFDDFEELVFPDHPIGRNILGSPESLQSVTRPDLLAFRQQHYPTDEMVICSVGNISFPRLIHLVEKQFGHIPDQSRTIAREAVRPYRLQTREIRKNTNQAHSVIGTTAFDLADERRLALHLLNNIIGGPGLNTRLNMTLREKNGLSYHTESHYSPYSDTGIISIYFSGDKKKLGKSRSVVHRELARLRDQTLGTLQLAKAKRQLLGQIAISAENHETLMLSMAKSYLVYGKVDSLKEIGRKIDAITAEEIRYIANEIFDTDRMSELTYI